MKLMYFELQIEANFQFDFYKEKGKLMVTCDQAIRKN